MTSSPTSRPSRPPRRRVREVAVARSVRLSPSVQRVTFAGPALDGFALGDPGGHVKLFLPPEGERTVSLPVPGPDGLVLPDGAPRPTVRTYTPRRFDPTTGELDVDVVLHGSGPASTWATRAGVGDRVGVAGPGRGYAVDPDATWFLLAGDETALPAIGAIAATLRAGVRALVLVELPVAADAQPLDGAADLDVTWLPRDGRPAGALLEPAVRALSLPDGDGRVWVAGEATVIRSIRAHLLDERGLARDHVVTRGYWKRGVSDHPDHDDGD